MPSTAPVSYTHLDVYKRQGQGNAVTVRLLSATDGRVVRDLVGHQAPDTTDARLGLTALSFSRDGSVLALSLIHI